MKDDNETKTYPAVNAYGCDDYGEDAENVELDGAVLSRPWNYRPYELPLQWCSEGILEDGDLIDEFRRCIL